MEEEQEQPEMPKLEIPQEVQLAPTDVLIHELFGRYTNCIIGLERVAAADKNQGAYKLRWAGSGFICAGLCSALEEEINTYRRYTEKPGDED